MNENEQDQPRLTLEEFQQMLAAGAIPGIVKQPRAVGAIIHIMLDNGSAEMHSVYDVEGIAIQVQKLSELNEAASAETSDETN